MEGAEPLGLQLIEKLPAAQCPQFLHKVVDGICGRAQPRFRDYGNIWNLREWLEVLEDSSTFFKTSVGKNEAFVQTADPLNGLSPEHQEAISKCLTSRKPELAEALAEKVCAMSSSYLQDFDWQLKLALSSDKLSTLQMPLVNLDLDIAEDGVVKPVSIELNKEELQNLINSLEAANKVCNKQCFSLLYGHTLHFLHTCILTELRKKAIDFNF
uniref:COMM domain containing 8 n=1 Tax=Leptobrachium leishanense TaxID=445787 RepID=A0A8C5MNB6_9ANUR